MALANALHTKVRLESFILVGKLRATIASVYAERGLLNAEALSRLIRGLASHCCGLLGLGTVFRLPAGVCQDAAVELLGAEPNDVISAPLLF